MLRSLTPNERTAVFVLAAITMPAEVCSGESEEWPKLWCHQVLGKLAEDLSLPRSNVSAYVPMITTDMPYHAIDWEQRMKLAGPYIGLANEANLSPLKMYVYLLIFLVELERCDGRGRVLMRNLAKILKIPANDALWLDNLLVNFLIAQQQQLAHTQDKKDRKYRYMKIGAVAVGAGAVIAVTAGMVSFFVILLLYLKSDCITGNRPHQQWPQLSF